MLDFRFGTALMIAAVTFVMLKLFSLLLPKERRLSAVLEIPLFSVISGIAAISTLL